MFNDLLSNFPMDIKVRLADNMGREMAKIAYVNLELLGKAIDKVTGKIRAYEEVAKLHKLSPEQASRLEALKGRHKRLRQYYKGLSKLKSNPEGMWVFEQTMKGKLSEPEMKYRDLLRKATRKSSSKGQTPFYKKPGFLAGVGAGVGSAFVLNKLTD